MLVCWSKHLAQSTASYKCQHSDFLVLLSYKTILKVKTFQEFNFSSSSVFSFVKLQHTQLTVFCDKYCMYNTERRDKATPTINKSPCDINMSHPAELQCTKQNRIKLHCGSTCFKYHFMIFVWTYVMPSQNIRTQITKTSLDRGLVTMSVGELLVNSTDLFFWDLTNLILILIHVIVTVYEWLPRKWNRVLFTLHHPVKIIRTILLNTPLASMMKLSVEIQWHGSNCLWIFIHVHADSPYMWPLTS